MLRLVQEILMIRQMIIKFTAVVMVTMVTAVSVHAFCHDAEATGLSYTSDFHGHSTHGNAAGGQSQNIPGADHSVPDHNDSCCACPCHTPLTAHPFQFAFSLQVIQLYYHDPFKALPEVYLPKFVPPHIFA